METKREQAIDRGANDRIRRNGGTCIFSLNERRGQRNLPFAFHTVGGTGIELAPRAASESIGAALKATTSNLLGA